MSKRQCGGLICFLIIILVFLVSSGLACTSQPVEKEASSQNLPVSYAQGDVSSPSLSPESAHMTLSPELNSIPQVLKAASEVLGAASEVLKAALEVLKAASGKKEDLKNADQKGFWERWSSTSVTVLTSVISSLTAVFIFFRRAKRDQENLNKQIKATFDQLQVTSHNSMVSAFANEDGFKNALRLLANPAATNETDFKAILEDPGVRVLLALKKTDLEKCIETNLMEFEQNPDIKGKNAKNLRRCLRDLLSPPKQEETS